MFKFWAFCAFVYFLITKCVMRMSYWQSEIKMKLYNLLFVDAENIKNGSN